MTDLEFADVPPVGLSLSLEQTIELRRIEPKKNQFRRYRIRRSRTLFDEDCLLIEWGRLGQPLRLRVETFHSPTILQERVEELIELRKKRGYLATSTELFQYQKPTPARCQTRSVSVYVGTQGVQSSVFSACSPAPVTALHSYNTNHAQTPGEHLLFPEFSNFPVSEKHRGISTRAVHTKIK